MIEQNENVIRVVVFAFVFLTMALLEHFNAKRVRVHSRRLRWFTNGMLLVVDSLALRIFLPVLAVGVADIAGQKGWGILSVLSAPVWLEIILAIIVLDLLVYGQHVATHKFTILWRFHKVHHVDRDIDVTTGIRFHPLEIIFSMLYKMICIVALGPAVVSVIIFEVLLNASAMFNHANVQLPKTIDQYLRKLVVTPDMHRVHHSTIVQETNSNYGFFLSVWDQVFNTYIDQPAEGHTGMRIGVAEYQTAKPTSLWWSLLLPFIREKPVGDSRELEGVADDN